MYILNNPLHSLPKRFLTKNTMKKIAKTKKSAAGLHFVFEQPNFRFHLKRLEELQLKIQDYQVGFTNTDRRTQRVEPQIQEFRQATDEYEYDVNSPWGGDETFVNENKIGGHAQMTFEALRMMGLSRKQAHNARKGNWQRDMSQAIVPFAVEFLGADSLFAILEILSLKEFKTRLDASEFGTYDPIEHIDNPAGELAANVYIQQNDSINNLRLWQGGDPDETAYAQIDNRYLNPIISDKILNPNDTYAFQIGNEYMPVYMLSTKEWIISTLKTSARLSTNQEKGKGPREFASATHALQDFFAHSNFCEVAVNMVINDIKRKKQKALNNGTNMAGIGIINSNAPYNRLAGFVSSSKTRTLDTLVHEMKPDSTKKSANLTFEGKEILITGTFNRDDTFASLLSELNDIVLSMNPFQLISGPNELVIAILDYLELQARDAFSEILNQILDTLDEYGILDTIENLVNAQIDSLRATIRAFRNIIAGLQNLIDDAREDLADLLVEIADVVISFAEFFLGDLESEKEEVKSRIDDWGEQKLIYNTLIDRFLDEIDKLENALEDFEIEFTGYKVKLDPDNDNFVLSNIYILLTPRPFELLKALARRIPIFGHSIEDMLSRIEIEINEVTRNLFSSLWQEVVAFVVSEIEDEIGALGENSDLFSRQMRGENNPTKIISNELLASPDFVYEAQNAYLSYCPPSHTQIGKDHPPMSSVAEHTNFNGERLNNDFQSDASYLNPLAERLARKATMEIGEVIKACWDKVEDGQNLTPADYNRINAKISDLYCHPSANQDFWRSEVISEILANSRLQSKLNLSIPGQSFQIYVTQA